MTPIRILKQQYDWLATAIADLRACRRGDHRERAETRSRMIRARSALSTTIYVKEVRKTRQALDLLASAERLIETADKLDVALDLAGSRPRITASHLGGRESTKDDR